MDWQIIFSSVDYIDNLFGLIYDTFIITLSAQKMKGGEIFMYAYWALFDVPQKTYTISGENGAQILKHFGDWLKCGSNAPESCIAYFCAKANATRSCFEVMGMKVEAQGSLIHISYDSIEEIELESGVVGKGIYRLAKTKDWINEPGKYSPLLCLMDKVDFDRVRKGDSAVTKYTNLSEVIKKHKAQNNWQAICDMFEPMDRLEQNNPHDIWNSDGDLCDLAFACSKLGEFQKGKGNDKDHLAAIKRYRDTSIRFYQRCEQLAPKNFRYPSGLGYRYYLSATELTQPKGRRDVKADLDIENALSSFERALALNPESVKDIYRTAKTLEIKLACFQFAKERSWSSEEMREKESIANQIVEYAGKASETYQILPEEKRVYCKKEYVRSLYTRACTLSEEINLRQKEYYKGLLLGRPVVISFDKQALKGLAQAREAMEECCKAELPGFFDKPLEDSDWAVFHDQWATSPLYKFYRLGLVNLLMFYIKTVLRDETNREVLRETADKYLRQALKIGDALRTRGKGAPSTWFIKENLAWLQILCGEPENAVRLLRGSRDAYIKNTCAIALMLTKNPTSMVEAEGFLKDALDDRYNLAFPWSVTLLCWLYELTGQEAKRQAIGAKYANVMAKKTYLRLLTSSPEEDYEG